MSEKVALVKAFTPTQESSRSDRLEYSSVFLSEAGKILNESRLNANMRRAEENQNSIEYGDNRLELLRSQLAFIAFMANNSESIEIRRRWVNSFTEQSIEIFGAPDTDLATKLVQYQVEQLLIGSGDTKAVEDYRNSAESLGLEVDFNESLGERSLNHMLNFEHLGHAARDFFNRKYGKVYDAMAIDSHEGLFSPEDIATTFEVGISELAQEDPEWLSWSVTRERDKNSLSVMSAKKRILVGMNRAEESGDRVAALFAHEVLRHALTSLNGSKNDKKLGVGLPGYLDFEEGAGIFSEYALTGQLKDELIDRYVDVGMALGYTNDGELVPRSKLLSYVMARENLRNQKRDETAKLTPENIEKKVYAHVNRIYRGTPGIDDIVGVYTKDIAYLEGFLKVGNYVDSEIEKGKSIDEVMEYILQGKFDPTNKSHADYVESIKRQRLASKELVLFDPSTKV